MEFLVELKSRWPMDRAFIELLRAAMDITGEERDLFLQKSCAGDEAKLLRARSLIARAVGDAMAVDPTALLEASAQPTRAQRDRTGQQIGAYELLRVIGSGGMGQVWLAQRTDDFAQQVAIKWTHGGALAETRLRFARERNILAKLAHPGIARIIDGGEQFGELWFAMEYVDGARLNDWICAQKPSLTSCITLFLKLCDAVQYAHENLIVHRDIKPSNKRTASRDCWILE
jgi:eukaryotic-like serine/threonine-protein kinase